MNACVFADCNSVMQQMAVVAGDVTHGCSQSTSAYSALEVFSRNALYKSTIYITLHMKKCFKFAF